MVDLVQVYFGGSVHALVLFYWNTRCHHRSNQTWESASRHFAMQMLIWENSVCDSYTHTHHTSNTTCSLRGLLQTQPRAVCVCSGHVGRSACISHSASDLFPTGPEQSDSTQQTAHLHLSVQRYYPSNFSHVSGIQTTAADPTWRTTGHYIHIITSHGSKTTWQDKYLYIHTETQDSHICGGQALASLCLWCRPLRRAKPRRNDIEEKHQASCK